MKRLAHLAAAALLAFVAACASPPAAPGFDDTVAAGYTTIETLAESALAASESGALSNEDRALARLALQQAKNLLDVASSLRSDGLTVEAAQKLQEAFNFIETARKLQESSP